MEVASFGARMVTRWPLSKSPFNRPSLKLKRYLALEREKVKAAQAQASAAKALTRAARAQAEAAYRSAIANENQAYQQRRQNAQQSINQGMKMLGGCSFGNC